MFMKQRKKLNKLSKNSSEKRSVIAYLALSFLDTNFCCCFFSLDPKALLLCIKRYCIYKYFRMGIIY